jgi:hypothetical protein
MPRTKSGLKTSFTYTLTGLFAQRITCFPFMLYLISCIYDMTPLSGAWRQYGVPNNRTQQFEFVPDLFLGMYVCMYVAIKLCIILLICMLIRILIHIHTYTFLSSATPSTSTPQGQPAPAGVSAQHAALHQFRGLPIGSVQETGGQQTLHQRLGLLPPAPQGPPQ